MLRPDGDGGVAVVVEPASTPDPVEVAEEPAVPEPATDVSAPVVTAPTGETGAAVAGDAAAQEAPAAASPDPSSSGVDELRCEPCGKTFKTPGGLAAHRTRLHGAAGQDD